MAENNEGMEKLGVDEDDNLKKEAQEDGSTSCPVCGKVAVKHGTVFVCPDHGSEPFERE